MSSFVNRVVIFSSKHIAEPNIDDELEIVCIYDKNLGSVFLCSHQRYFEMWSSGNLKLYIFGWILTL